MNTKKTLSQRLSRMLTLALLLVGLAGLNAQAQTVSDTPENKAKMEYNEGLKLAKEADFAGALGHFEKGIQIDPKNSKNYYMKAFALRKLDRDMESIEWYQKAIDAATKEGDKTIAAKAKENIGSGYVAMAAVSLQNNRASEAIEHLKKATEFVGDPDADMHFYFAKAYNTAGDYNLALDHAQKGVDLEKGSAAQKARYYFELGTAYKNMGNKDAAKTAYQQAAYGPYKKSAEYELSIL